MIVEMETIEEQLKEAYKAAEEVLMKQFPNLYFYIAPDGKLTSWVRTSEGRDGAGIHMKYTINVGQIYFHQWKYLKDLNEAVEPVHTQPDKYFYCTECGKVKPREEFEANVFAGYYCKECAEKPSIKALIAESRENGFYE